MDVVPLDQLTQNDSISYYLEQQATDVSGRYLIHGQIIVIIFISITVCTKNYTLVLGKWELRFKGHPPSTDIPVGAPY